MQSFSLISCIAYRRKDARGARCVRAQHKKEESRAVSEKDKSLGMLNFEAGFNYLKLNRFGRNRYQIKATNPVNNF